MLRKKRGYKNHRKIYEELMGRIPAGWHVHHVNSKKWDNRIKNLIALPAHFHAYIHESQFKESINNKKKYNKCIWSRGRIEKELQRYLICNDKRVYRLTTNRAKRIADFGD